MTRKAFRGHDVIMESEYVIKMTDEIWPNPTTLKVLNNGKVTKNSFNVCGDCYRINITDRIRWLYSDINGTEWHCYVQKHLKRKLLWGRNPNRERRNQFAKNSCNIRITSLLLNERQCVLITCTRSCFLKSMSRQFRLATKKSKLLRISAWYYA